METADKNTKRMRKRQTGKRMQVVIPLAQYRAIREFQMELKEVTRAVGANRGGYIHRRNLALDDKSATGDRFKFQMSSMRWPGWWAPTGVVWN